MIRTPMLMSTQGFKHALLPLLLVMAASTAQAEGMCNHAVQAQQASPATVASNTPASSLQTLLPNLVATAHAADAAPAAAPLPVPAPAATSATPADPAATAAAPAATDTAATPAAPAATATAATPVDPAAAPAATATPAAATPAAPATTETTTTVTTTTTTTTPAVATPPVDPAASTAAPAAAPAATAPAATPTAIAGTTTGAKPYEGHVQCVDGKCKVDTFLIKGFRTFSQCQVCHGIDGTGSTIAPNLMEKLQALDHTVFVDRVTNGYQGQIGVMPPWKDNPNVMNNVENLYAYLKARSDNVIPAGNLERF